MAGSRWGNQNFSGGNATRTDKPRAKVLFTAEDVKNSFAEQIKEQHAANYAAYVKKQLSK